MAVYYNEIDPFCAQWLRNLMDAGHIARGDIDTRSIEDVRPSDVTGYVQCHFFAGLGGWAHALDLAGWPRDRPVWTGSCPCQPFSAAGKGAGFADERHLWPAWQHLIAQCRPATIFGEQVASKDAAPWIDLVHADLEGMGYAFGCEPFPAAGVGAPHIRDRNYWVADLCSEGLAQRVSHGRVQREALGARAGQAFVGSNNALGMGNTVGSASARDAGGVSGPETEVDSQRRDHGSLVERLEHAGTSVLRLADTEQRGDRSQTQASNHERAQADRPSDQRGRHCGASVQRPSPANGFWRDADWLLCTDGKWRPVEPGTFPLAHGVPGRVGRLRAYGNAIVPQAAAEFIGAYLDAQQLEQVAA